eukprot:g3894.t1
MPVATRKSQSRKSSAPNSPQKEQSESQTERRRSRDRDETVHEAPTKRRRCEPRRGTKRPRPSPLFLNLKANATKSEQRLASIRNKDPVLEHEETLEVIVLSYRREGPLVIARCNRIEGDEITTQIELIFNNDVSKLFMPKVKHLTIYKPWQEFDLPTCKTVICNVVAQQ